MTLTKRRQWAWDLHQQATDPIQRERYLQEYLAISDVIELAKNRPETYLYGFYDALTVALKGDGP